MTVCPTKSAVACFFRCLFILHIFYGLRVAPSCTVIILLATLAVPANTVHGPIQWTPLEVHQKSRLLSHAKFGDPTKYCIEAATL